MSEEEMTQEDEELLEEMTPKVRKLMSEFTGFTDEDIKDALWFNYMELEPTLKQLRSEYILCTEVATSH